MTLEGTSYTSGVVHMLQKMHYPAVREGLSYQNGAVLEKPPLAIFMERKNQIFALYLPPKVANEKADSVFPKCSEGK